MVPRHNSKLIKKHLVDNERVRANDNLRILVLSEILLILNFKTLSNDEQAAFYLKTH